MINENYLNKALIIFIFLVILAAVTHMVAAYYISGYVTDSSTGMPLSNASVTTNTGLVTSTDTYGFYNLTDIDNGTYLINASLPGYSTSSSERVINSTDIDNANISLSPLLDPTYSISGYVFDNYGLGLVDVLVHNGSYQNTTVESGYYLITGLLNGTYNFSYSKTEFDTGYLNVTISGADNISANITIYDTTPLAQVTGLMNDTPTQTTVNLSWDPISDANYYQVFRNSTSLGFTQNTYWNDTDLTPGASYQYEIRANDSYSNWGQNSSVLTVTMNNVSLSITASSPDNDTTTTVGTAQEFEIVLNRDADITWYINDSIIQSNLSAISANYTNSTAGAGVYNVTAIASDDYYSISRTWNWTVIDQTAPGGGGDGGGGVGSYNISGYVLDSSNLKPLSIANVTTNTSLQTTTDLNGFYNFSGLINGSYMISASLMGYADNYINRTISGADVSYANITLSPLSCTDCHYSISYMNSFGRSDLYVNQTMVNESVHVALSCKDCHTDTSIHPPPKSGWKWCEDCHANTQNPRTDKGRHNIVNNPWNNLYNGISVVNITSCTTCHDPTLYNNSKNTYGKEKGIDCDYCHSFPDNVVEVFSITAALFLIILSNRYNNN